MLDIIRSQGNDHRYALLGINSRHLSDPTAYKPLAQDIKML